MRKRYSLVVLVISIAVLSASLVQAQGTGFTPTPSKTTGVKYSAIVDGARAVPGTLHSAAPRNPRIPYEPQGAPLLLKPAVDKFDFEDNPTFNGVRVIPPDPYVAVGPEHTVNVGNLLIQWQTKAVPGVSEHLEKQTSASHRPITFG